MTGCKENLGVGIIPNVPESDVPAVVDLIVERVRSNSQPGNRRDPFKVGRLIEGGAMRGVWAGGAAIAAQALGLDMAFDAEYSASSGSCSAIYAAARQTVLGATIYYEDLVTRFINPRRLLINRPVVDIRYLTHQVMMYRKVLDWQRVIAYPIPINVYATNALTGQAVNMYPFNNRGAIYEAMLRSCSMPFWADMPSPENRFLTDGSIATTGIPFRQAVEDNCTHVFAMLTRPEGVRKKRSFLDRIVSLALWNAGFDQIASAYWQAFNHYNEVVEHMVSLEGDFVNEQPRVKIVRPSWFESKIPSFCTDPRRLYRGALSGFHKMRQAFPALPVDSNVQPSGLRL